MGDAAELRALRVTGKPLGAPEPIRLRHEPRRGTTSHRTSLTAPDRLKAAFHPSMDVDFDDPDEEDGGS